MFNFNNRKIDYNKIISELIEAYSLLVDPQKIIAIAKGRILEYFDINDISFFEKDEEGNYSNKDLNINISKDSNLVSWLLNNNGRITIDDNSLNNYVNSELDKIETLNPQYIFPIIIHNNLVLITIINCEKLIKEDLEFIELVFKLTGLSYQNSIRLNRERQKLHKDYQQEKLATIGQMASSLAHEIKNPLTAIRSSVQFINKMSKEEEMGEISGTLIEEVDRINEITDSLLKFSKPIDLIMKKIDLSIIIDSVTKLYKTSLVEKNIKLEIDKNYEGNIFILGDKNSFKQVFTNFLVNSIHALENKEGNKNITIKLSNEKDIYLSLKWLDSGIGIDENRLEKIFEPFFTSKKLGTGLGLAIVKQILDQHQYKLKVSSKVGKGTKFEFEAKIIEKD